MIELQLTRLHEDAVLPAPAYGGDAGLDLASREHVVLRPGGRAVVGTGLAVAIPPGHAGLEQPQHQLRLSPPRRQRRLQQIRPWPILAT